MTSKYNQYLKKHNLMKKTFIFYNVSGKLGNTFLDQPVDVGINVGSRYAQSIHEMLVRNPRSCLGLHMLHYGKELLI
jgi:hypothetical protein